MNRDVPKTESSLLLQLPKSISSFSDMSGNSFLMPVAVDNVAAPEKPVQGSSGLEKGEEISKATDRESASVCQLQQPLLVRRGSSPAPKMSVPYSESSTPTTNVDLVQMGPPLQPPPSSVSSSMGQTVQSSHIFSGFQNRPPVAQAEAVGQSNPTQPKPLDQESNVGYQNIYSPHLAAPLYSYPVHNVPATSNIFPTFTETSSVPSSQKLFHSSVADYYCQPPVITPSPAPSYYSSSGSTASPTPYIPYETVFDQNLAHPNYAIPPYEVITGQNSAYQVHNMYSSNMPTEICSRVYEPVKPYWLFKVSGQSSEKWYGFCAVDSDRLETAFQQDPQAVVPVDGGRYDALLSERIKKHAYIETENLEIRRCTWFYYDSTHRFVPFTEDASNFIEQTYSNCCTSGRWQKRIRLPGMGNVILESPERWYSCKTDSESWPVEPDPKESFHSVKRGLPVDLEIMAEEKDHIDHLMFIVQGIGSVCDLRFRTVSQCVDGFREMSNQLLSTHFRQELDSGRVGRVEFLPLAWHAKLHTSDKGFDRCVQSITLPSIGKLRHFTNDTLLDILLYSSPFYCQMIIDTVALELNKLYKIFLERNPGFSGKVFVAGHSLGSLILFDILSHQKVEEMSNNESDLEKNTKSSVESDTTLVLVDNIEKQYDSITSLLEACQLEDYIELFEKERIDLSSVSLLSNDDLKGIGLPTGPRKKILKMVQSCDQFKSLPPNEDDMPAASRNGTSRQQNISDEENQFASDRNIVFPYMISPCMQSISYPRLNFEPAGFFALGSPIAMFMAVRGYDAISEDFRLPTCPAFFHIFHPYDPVAYRVEPLIDPNFSAKPVLIPHHKGRKRMHLEIRESLSRVGSEVKHRVLETLRYTWDSISGLARGYSFSTAAIEAEVDKLVSQQMSESVYEPQVPEASGEELQIGSLNGGRRIDYVLQEKPIEALNDYIFALTSHSTYWNSEDTALLMLKEIYGQQGIWCSSRRSSESKEDIHPEYSSEGARAEPVSPSVFPLYSVPPPVVPASQSLHSMSIGGWLNPSASQAASNMPQTGTTTERIEPPPLTGFIKKSPFTR